jgi:DNA modification methylase
LTSSVDKEASKLSKEEWREFTKTVWHIANVSHPKHPAVFPAEIPHRLVKLFSFVGETVLDPFAGVGTTAKAAVALDRRAISVEQNADYARIIAEEVASPLSDVREADSRDLHFIDDGSIGLVVTSPPYWNKADYGSGPANLGNIGSYPRFFREIRPVFEECYRVLAPGRKVAVVTANVNQHTDHGLLTFPLATDFTVLLRDIGFVLINELIWSKDRTGGRWGSANQQRPIFGSYPYPPNFLFKNVHEYILVFAKPPKQATRGPKVLSYRSLMEATDRVEPVPERHNGNGHNGNGHNGNGNGGSGTSVG